jgi:hypothetical protein
MGENEGGALVLLDGEVLIGGGARGAGGGAAPWTGGAAMGELAGWKWKKVPIGGPHLSVTA